LRALATGSDHAGGVTAGLAALANLPTPDRAAVAAAVEALHTAVAAVPKGADQALDLAARQSRLLREALELRAAHGDRPCPVCGAAELDATWKARAERELADDGANQLVALRGTVTDRRSTLDGLLANLQIPEPVPGVELASLARARSAVKAIRDAPADDRAFADPIAARVDELVTAKAALRAEAGAAAAAREESFQPWSPSRAFPSAMAVIRGCITCTGCAPGVWGGLVAGGARACAADLPAADRCRGRGVRGDDHRRVCRADRVDSALHPPYHPRGIAGSNPRRQVGAYKAQKSPSGTGLWPLPSGVVVVAIESAVAAATVARIAGDALSGGGHPR
jgi:hypothetical protein